MGQRTDLFADQSSKDEVSLFFLETFHINKDNVFL